LPRGLAQGIGIRCKDKIFQTVRVRQLFLELRGKSLPEMVRRDSHRFRHVPESILRDDPVLFPAQENPNGRLINRGIAEKIISSRQVEVQLAGKLRYKFADLQLDDDVAVQPGMVEQQIEIKILVPDFKMILAAEKCKSDPEFDKEIPEFLKGVTGEVPARILRNSGPGNQKYTDP
jgi:hypothetical protein